MTKLRTKMADIGCLIRISEETPMAAIRQAIALAAENEAHLIVAIGVQHFTAPYTPFWTGMATSIVAEVNAKTQTQADSLADTIRREAAAAGVDVDIDIITGNFVDVAASAANAARSVDLVVVDQQHGAFDTAEMLLEEALFRSGRPVLVASAKRPALGPVKKVVVGWDGSAHVVRAVSDALAVFPGIEKIEIVTVTGEKSLVGRLPAAQFARHLARKGVEAVLTEIDAKGRSVASVLDQHASANGFDLIVTGAFGHSRLREFLLGGVTVELTSDAKSSVLMSY